MYDFFPGSSPVSRCWDHPDPFGTCVVRLQLRTRRGTEGAAEGRRPGEHERAGLRGPVPVWPSTTAFLQNFLAYWSTLEYQQSVVWNEYYNYQANILSPAVPQVENQQMQLGWTTTSSNPYGTCQQTASVSNVTSGTDSGCQWQQNIADVWPGTQYSDEVGLWGDTATVPSAASTNSLSGLAVSAVPYGLGTSASVNPANVGTGEMVTPQSIASLCQSSTAGVLQINCSSTTLSGYSASNALSSFNGVSAGTYLAPYDHVHSSCHPELPDWPTAPQMDANFVGSGQTV